MPAHGNHGEAIYGRGTDIEAAIRRVSRQAKPIDRFDCVDVATGSERAEEVNCLRWGDDPVFEDMLVVTNTPQEERFLFGGYVPSIGDDIQRVLWVQGQVILPGGAT